MTEAESWEVVAAFSANALASFTVYISFTFAYLTAAYMVAGKLSKFQVLVGSGLYVAFAGCGAVSCIVSCNAFETVISAYPTVLDTQVQWSIPWQTVMSIIFSVGTLVSLFFMYDLRRRAERVY